MSKHATSWFVVAITAIVAGCIYAQSIHTWGVASVAGLVAVVGTSIKASLTQTPQDAKTAAVAGAAVSLAAEYAPDASTVRLVGSMPVLQPRVASPAHPTSAPSGDAPPPPPRPNPA